MVAGPDGISNSRPFQQGNSCDFRGTLSERDLLDLRNSGLDDESIRAGAFYTEKDPKRIAELLGWDSPAYCLGDSLIIPYFSPDSCPIDYHRVKPSRPRLGKNGRACKYEGPRGKPAQAYRPPIKGPEPPEEFRAVRAVVEGEKKTAAGLQNGIRCVGISGNWAWQMKRPKDANGDAIGPRELIESLREPTWNGVPSLIILDNDGPENDGTRLAGICFAEVLARLGSSPKIIRLPAILGPDGKPVKTGLDDFLKVHPVKDFWHIVRGTQAFDFTYTREGLVYFCGILQLTLAELKGRWQVIIARDGKTVGADTISLSSSRARSDFLRRTKALKDEERLAVENKLVSLIDRISHDWSGFLAWHDKRQAEWIAKQAKERVAAEEKDKEERLKEMEPAAFRVLDDPRLLWRVAKAVAKRGVVGERANALLIFLAIASQITDAPISIIIKGESAGGKSFLVLQVLSLFPDWSHVDLTSMSAKLLIYDDRSYSHKTCVIFEVAGQQDPFIDYLIRTLISEGCIKYSTVESTPEGMVARHIEKPGPTNFISTTTAPQVHAENETRLWSLLVDDSQRMTQHVLRMQAKIAEGKFAQRDDPDLRIAFTWLRSKGLAKYTIPFAEKLSAKMPEVCPLRLRRDFPRLLQLVGMCAILHQRQRQKDDQGRVVANLSDYGAARVIAGDVFRHGVLGLSEKTYDLVEILKGLVNPVGTMDTASYADLVKASGKNKMYVARWLKPAIDLGVVDNVTGGQKGKAAALKMGAFNPGGYGGLPEIGKLDPDYREPWTDPLTGKPYQYHPKPTVTVFPARSRLRKAMARLRIRLTN
jgi:hypothetical protein